MIIWHYPYFPQSLCRLSCYINLCDDNNDVPLFISMLSLEVLSFILCKHYFVELKLSSQQLFFSECLLTSLPNLSLSIINENTADVVSNVSCIFDMSL